MTDFINTPAYFFNAAPPLVPRLYFNEKSLMDMAILGCLIKRGSWPPAPPQYTVFPGGRWTIHFHPDKPPYDGSQTRDMVKELLPGIKMQYHDFNTGRHWIWILTNEVLHRDNNNDLRIGHWPD